MKKLIGLALFIAALLTVGTSTATAATPAVTVDATINGQNVATSSQTHPIRLDPATPAHLQLRLTNTTGQPITIASVQLTGRVAGLTFYAFDTSTNLTIPPTTTSTLAYFLNLTGLRGQATGLIGGALTLTNPHGHVVAHQATVTDVRGSLNSVYGFFGLALLILTTLALLDLALALARHRLPANRWRRATRFLTPGIGIGLVLVFTLSATRIWVPNPTRWWLFTAAFAATFFTLGYLTPTPTTPDDDEPDTDDDNQQSDNQQSVNQQDDDLMAHIAPSATQYERPVDQSVPSGAPTWTRPPPGALAPPTNPAWTIPPPPPGPPDAR